MSLRNVRWMWMCKAKKRRNKNALTHMFGVLDWRDVSRCIIKKSRILSYFWLCSRSGRSAKRRSESALTHMFCVLDWHDVSRCIASLKKFEKSYATFDWVHPASQRSIPKAEKQKRSHSHVLRSRNVNRAHKFNKSYDTFDWVHAAVHPWTQTKAA